MPIPTPSHERELTDEERVLLVGLGAYHGARLAHSSGDDWPDRFDYLNAAQRVDTVNHARHLTECVQYGYMTLTVREAIIGDDSTHIVILEWLEGSPTLIDVRDLRPWFPIDLEFTVSSDQAAAIARSKAACN